MTSNLMIKEKHFFNFFQILIYYLMSTELQRVMMTVAVDLAAGFGQMTSHQLIVSSQRMRMMIWRLLIRRYLQPMRDWLSRVN